MKLRCLILILFSLPYLKAYSQASAPSVSNDENVLADLEQQIQEPDGALKALTEKVQKTVQGPAFASKMEEELSKYRIRFSVDLDQGFLTTDFLRGDLSYQFEVEPAFRNKEQARKDIWNLSVGGGASVFSAGTQIRLTFIRYFSGTDAKKKALFAPVKWLWQAPLNTNDIKTKMSVGEGFRIEVIGNLSAGKGLNEIAGKKITSVGGSLARSGSMIIDLYKVSEKTVRGRFIGFKNGGELNVSASIKSTNFLDWGPRKLKELLSIGVGAHLRNSLFSFNDPLKIDTLMVDYLFNFSTTHPLPTEDLKSDESTGEAALEELLMNMKNTRLVRLFFMNISNTDLMAGVREYSKIADEIAREDLEKYRNRKAKFSELRAYNYFKGRLNSKLTMMELNARAGGLLSGESQSGSVKSHVSTFDNNNEIQYYWLDNSFVIHKSRMLFGRNNSFSSHDVDILTLSNAKKEIRQLQDIVIRTRLEDTSISKGTMEEIKNTLLHSLPEDFTNDPGIEKTLSAGKKTNAYLSIRRSFGDSTFKVLSQIDKATLALKIYDFLDNHPQRRYMNLPSDRSQESGTTIGLGSYAEEKAYELAAIFDPKNNHHEIIKAFEIARRDPVFEHYIVTEFLSRLLPKNNASPHFAYDIKFSSAETGTLMTSGGQNQISNVYEAVSFIRTIITDQSMDMQLITQESDDGEEVLVPFNQQGVLKSRKSIGKDN